MAKLKLMKLDGDHYAPAYADYLLSKRMVKKSATICKIQAN